MWETLQKTCKLFRLHKKNDIFQYVNCGLQTANAAVKENMIDMSQEIILDVCSEIVNETFSILNNSDLPSNWLYTMGAIQDETVASQQKIHGKLFYDIVEQLNILKTSILRNSITIPNESLIEENVSLFKVHDAIEKTGSIILALEGHEPDKEPQELNKLFRTYKDFVLIGEAGTGKSWSLNLFYSTLYGELQGNSKPCWIPIYIAVKEIIDDLVDQKMKSNKFRLFLKAVLKKNHIFSQLVSKKNLIHRMNQSGCFLFIFDGLNEVAIELRKEFKSYFIDLREEYPNNRYVITSRTLHWDKTMFPELRPVIEILKLTVEEIEEFIRKYFSEKGPEVGSDLIERLKRPDIVKSMEDVISNPFFLDKIIRLFEMETTIPKNRGDLLKLFLKKYAKDPHWFDLQNWMLGYVGLYIRYINSTEISEETANNLLFHGFVTAYRDLFLYEYQCIIPDGYLIDVESGDKIKQECTLAINKDNKKLKKLAETDGRVTNIDDNSITIKTEDLLKIRNEYFIKLSWRYDLKVEDGQVVEKGDVLAVYKVTPDDIIESPVNGRVVLTDEGILLEPIIYTPIESDCFLKQLMGKNINKTNTIAKEFTNRFKGSTIQVWRCYYELFERIRKNGFLEIGRKDGKVEFWHQTFLEYFAALHFYHIYNFDPSYLEFIIRFRKFDEMLHLVIGCIFEEEKDIVLNILKLLLKQSQIKEVHDCLSKAERIEKPAKMTLLMHINQLIGDPKAPDEARGAVIECLLYLRDQDEKEDVLKLLTESNLQEGIVMWRALLGVSYQFCHDDKSFQNLLSLGLENRERKKELLIATANWLGENKLGPQWLAEELCKCSAADYDFDLLKALWVALKRFESFILSLDQWEFVLDHISDPKLYNNILIFEHSFRSQFCKHYFSESKLISTIERFGNIKKDWHVPLVSLLKLTLVLDITKKNVMNSIIAVCSKHSEFPYELLEFMWKLGAKVVLDLEIDIITLKWCQDQDIKKRPSSLGENILHCFKGIRKETLSKFSRDIEFLTRLAVTYDVKLADELIVIIYKIVRACNEMDSLNYWQKNILSHMQFPDIDVIFHAFDSWNEMDDNKRSAWLVVARKTMNKFKEETYIQFWNKNLVKHFQYLTYIGRGTDRFVRSRPDLIKNMLLNFDLDNTIEKNLDYIKELISNDKVTYSTRIVIYTVMSSSETWRRIAKHPGHHMPARGTEYFKSFIRLLYAEMINEAAYSLCLCKYKEDCEPIWAQIEKDIPKDLHQSFNQAKKVTYKFIDVEKDDIGILEDAKLRTRSGIEELIKFPGLLKKEQILILLEDLFSDSQDRLSKKRIEALSLSTVFNKCEEIQITGNSIVEMGISSERLRLDEKEKNLIQKYRLKSGKDWLSTLRETFIVFNQSINVESILPVVKDLSIVEKTSFDILINTIERIHNSGFVWNFRDSDRILPYFIRTENIKLQDDYFRFADLYQRSFNDDFDDVFDVDLDDVSDDVFSRWHERHHYTRRNHDTANDFHLYLFRHFYSLSLPMNDICQILATLLDDAIERIGKNMFRSLIIKLAKLSWYTDEINYSHLEELIKELKTENLFHIDIESLKQTPQHPILKKKNVLFAGNYAHILIIIAKAIRELANHEKSIDFCTLSELLRGNMEFIFDSKNDLTWHEFTRSIFHCKDSIINDDIKKADKAFLFMYMLLGLGIRAINLDVFKSISLSNYNALQIIHDELEQNLLRIRTEYNIQQNEIKSFITLFKKLEQFINEEKKRAQRRESLLDIRTAFFWHIRFMDVKWMTIDNLDNVTNMFGKLPESLLIKLDDDILDDLLSYEDVQENSLWRLLQLKVISMSSHKRKLRVNDLKKIVSVMLEFGKKININIAPGIIANTVCIITSKEQKEMNKYVKTLEKILVQLLIKDYQGTTIWSDNKLLNETIWRIVQGIKTRTGIKMNIPANFKEFEYGQ